jgi:hypothetical protein
MTERISIRPASLRDLSWVAAFMRAADRREVFALSPDDNPLALAARIDAMPGEKLAACLDGTPVAAFGAARSGPGVVEVWMFATPDWPRVAPAVTRAILRRLVPALVASGIHRAQCLSIEGHGDAHRWLERMGAVREGVHPGRGRGGETFITYAWRRGDAAVERLLVPARPCHPFQPAEKGAIPHVCRTLQPARPATAPTAAGL